MARRTEWAVASSSVSGGMGRGRYQAARDMAAQAIDGGLDAGLGIARLRFPGPVRDGDRRAGTRSFTENVAGEATFAGRWP